ncbi:hypothetical protein JL36_08450 [Lactococcus cremoris]|nr:hypothetical protein JL36_08450 [Lactococcus cremoris]
MVYLKKNYLKGKMGLEKSFLREKKVPKKTISLSLELKLKLLICFPAGKICSDWFQSNFFSFGRKKKMKFLGFFFHSSRKIFLTSFEFKKISPV